MFNVEISVVDKEMKKHNLANESHDTNDEYDKEDPMMSVYMMSTMKGMSLLIKAMIMMIVPLFSYYAAI